MNWFKNTKPGRQSLNGINIKEQYVYISRPIFEELKGQKVSLGYDSDTQEVVLKPDKTGLSITTVGANKNCGMIYKLAQWFISMGAKGRYTLNFSPKQNMWKGVKVSD